ncbi:RNA-guided endonuclease TnpB family protein [Nonomuraea sp. NPDC050786]|uniref:RNA-guided endonuclease InsQ/TnpB family protein n=1 Tax=Nonomuraea sp. NPDC050786 TaxID=3154840 RepID=UPI0033ED1029
MKLRYNYRLYPDAGQRQMLAKTFGCARVVWNDALAARKAARKAGRPFIGDAEIQRVVLTQAKKTPERAWLAEVSSVVLQQSVRDVNTAYRNFFDSVSGRRKGPKMGLPVLKSRHDRRQSARFNANAFTLTGEGRLYLAKIGQVEVRWSRGGLPVAPSSVTVIKDAAGRYFASFVIDVLDADQLLPEVGTEVGIDLGLTHYAVLSTGEKIANPKWLRRREKKLARLQRELSRKQKGSKNRDMARLKVARQHAEVADARRDFLHQTSTSILRENQTVCIETLSVRGLARSRLAKAVHEVSWGAFIRLLEDKAARRGRTLVKTGRYFPSSQLCPCCGRQTGKLPLDVREWDCPGCGEHHDRDIAAAINILTEGTRCIGISGSTVAAGLAGHGINDCGGQVRPGAANPTLAPPATHAVQAA